MKKKIRQRILLTTYILIALLAGYSSFVSQASTINSGATNEAVAHRYHAEFSTVPTSIKAGVAAELIFNVKNEQGRTTRFLQFVHEKPMHLLVVSEDLAEFAHIHPELMMEDTYNVTHRFPHGGRYFLFADYTPPGSGQMLERFEVTVTGAPRTPVRLKADSPFVNSANGLCVTMTTDQPLRAGDDLTLQFKVADAQSKQPVNDLQLYLGALAHFVIISEDRNDFIHAHPLNDGEVFDPGDEKFTSHIHDPAELAKVLVGPSPSEVRATTSFPRAGLYKLWAQFRRHEEIITLPFVLNIAPAEAKARKTAAPLPADTINITISDSGYEPSAIQVKRGQAIRLAFTRTEASACGGTVVFPALNLRQKLAVGETSIIEITPQEAGELRFTCGMGMYKGSLIVN